MWNYEKRLQYPINIKNCNPTLAAMIISQYGGLYFNKVYNVRNLVFTQDCRLNKNMAEIEKSPPFIFARRNTLPTCHSLYHTHNDPQHSL